MFNCVGCDANREEIKFLREQVKGLTDRLIAMTSIQALQAVGETLKNPEEYFGGGRDPYVGFDEMGRQIILEKEIDLNGTD